MTAPVPPRLPEGVWVMDLTWILVGPGATRWLASMGAEVMCIEPTAPRRIDLVRHVPPCIQDNPGPPEDPYGMFCAWDERFDRSGYYGNTNPGQHGIRLHMQMSVGVRLRSYNVLQSRQADVLQALRSSQARDGVHSGPGRHL